MRIRPLLLALLLAAPAAGQVRVTVPAIGGAPALAVGQSAATLAAPSLAPLTPALSLSPALAASAEFKPSALILPASMTPAPAAATPLQRSGAGVQLLLDLARTPQEREAAQFTGVFDGSKAPKDGALVTPNLVYDRPQLGLPMMLAVTRDAVHKLLPALRESVALGSWNGPRTTLDESCCGDAAPKLAALLRAKGVPARLVEAEFHYYVMIETPEAQIIVDPTIRQFFGKKQAPRGIPDVFVGTTGDLNELFEHYRGAKTTKYGPLRIYFADAYVREAQLLKVEQDIHRGGPRDLEPLRRELGYPPPPPARPKLIVP
ncbi:MAG: hypothetical protein M0D55_03045 [Elusimicrobiota bacterium]|nr:MAG: hypothetical protein M0D55_03045 [Elusimicrobiota bacterium]